MKTAGHDRVVESKQEVGLQLVERVFFTSRHQKRKGKVQMGRVKFEEGDKISSVRVGTETLEETRHRGSKKKKSFLALFSHSGEAQKVDKFSRKFRTGGGRLSTCPSGRLESRKSLLGFPSNPAQGMKWKLREYDMERNDEDVNGVPRRNCNARLLYLLLLLKYIIVMLPHTMLNSRVR